MGDGYNRLEKKSDDWADRQAGKLADHPIRTSLGWFVKLCIALFVLSLLGGAIFGVGSWVGAWGGEAKRITGPQNVREQYTEIIGDWNGMQAAAVNACGAKDAAKQAGDPTLLEDPAFAYKAKYQQITVDYNRRQNNLFEGKLVGPKGYPRVAPTLKQMEAEVC